MTWRWSGCAYMAEPDQLVSEERRANGKGARQSKDPESAGKG